MLGVCRGRPTLAPGCGARGTSSCQGQLQRATASMPDAGGGYLMMEQGAVHERTQQAPPATAGVCTALAAQQGTVLRANARRGSAWTAWKCFFLELAAGRSPAGPEGQVGSAYGTLAFTTEGCTSQARPGARRKRRACVAQPWHAYHAPGGVALGQLHRA